MNIQQRLMTLVEELEPQLGYKMILAREHLDEHDNLLALEAVEIAASDAPANSDLLLAEIGAIAIELGVPREFTAHAEVTSSYSLPAAQELQELASKFASSGELEEVIGELSTLYSRPPGQIELLKFLRLISADSHFKEVVAASKALKSNNFDEARSILMPRAT